MLWLPGFSQIKPHTDGFIVTRSFLELVSARFDSLKHYKVFIKDTESLLDSCSSAITEMQFLNKMQNNRFNLILEENIGYKQTIESYKRDVIVYKDIEKKIKQEVRKKKTWKIIGITAGTILLGSIILLAI